MKVREFIIQLLKEDMDNELVIETHNELDRRFHDN